MTTRKLGNPWRPDWVVAPGEVLRERLTELGMTQAVLAELLGMKQSYVSNIMTGHRAISGQTAVRLETVPGLAVAEFWARLQADYDVNVARQQAGRKAPYDGPEPVSRRIERVLAASEDSNPEGDPTRNGAFG